MLWHFVTTFEKMSDLERHPVLANCGARIDRPVLALSSVEGKACSACRAGYRPDVVTDRRGTYAIRDLARTST